MFSQLKPQREFFCRQHFSFANQSYLSLPAQHLETPIPFTEAQRVYRPSTIVRDTAALCALLSCIVWWVATKPLAAASNQLLRSSLSAEWQRQTPPVKYFPLIYAVLALSTLLPILPRQVHTTLKLFGCRWRWRSHLSHDYVLPSECEKHCFPCSRSRHRLNSVVALGMHTMPRGEDSVSSPPGVLQGMSLYAFVDRGVLAVLRESSTPRSVPSDQAMMML